MQEPVRSGCKVTLAKEYIQDRPLLTDDVNLIEQIDSEYLSGHQDFGGSGMLSRAGLQNIHLRIPRNDDLRKKNEPATDYLSLHDKS